jgi:16S rRNA (guanine966-N2)-methyltransferase
MRIIAGAWRGRRLLAPAGEITRPTSQRMRQAIFDMLMHAPWGGLALLEGALVLDAFAGTGAMGLEALSRGAGLATFLEQAPEALSALQANISACRAEGSCRVLAADVRRPPRGERQDIVFLDPPYESALIPQSLAALRQTGWVVSGTLIVSEYARQDHVVPGGEVMSSRVHGPARVTVWREN